MSREDDDGQLEDVRSVRRREAKSGKVSYGEPVLLHETARRRVVLVPFFIPRTEGTDLAVKLVTYRKSQVGWMPWEEKSLSLDESAARSLLRALRDHLAVAGEESDGSYLLLRVSDGTAQIGEHDPAAVASALSRVLSQTEILEHLGEVELSDEFVRAMRGAIRLNEMRSAVAQLREFLTAGETSESVYQSWCEQHCWAFGNAYVMRDDTREISPGDHLDLLLPSVISGYRDIVELKRPDAKVLLRDEGHRNYYFSSDVSRALGQAHRYLDVLHEVAANGLRDHPEVVAYHPRAIIVIGRSNGWRREEELKALHGLNRRLSGVTVMTYDQLLAQGERLIEMLEPSEGESVGEATDDLPTWEDDPPF